LEHPAGAVAEADQGREPLAGHRAAGGERRAAVGDGPAVAALDLADRAVVADEEAALADVLEWRGRGKSRRRRRLVRRRGRGNGHAFRQAPDGAFELAGQVAVRLQAIAVVVEPFLPAPGAEHQLRVVDEVAVD